VISSSVPTNVGLSSEQSLYDHLEFVSSDFSCTSSVTSSRSGIGKKVGAAKKFHFPNSTRRFQIQPMSHRFHIVNRDD
jgi:hypothetical protein